MDHRRLRPRRRIAVPGAPTITSAIEANPVQWLPPTSNGGSPITEYRVYADGGLFETVAAPETSTVNSVAGGSAVQVSAVNAVGEGPKSAPVVAT
jgi:levanase